MSNPISKTVAQYKDFPQLQEFAEAQQTTIIQLSKKLQKMEEERDHLKKLLESVPTISNNNSNIKQFEKDDAEFICNMEIGKLREISMARELTYEEAKKLSEYHKILTQINSKPKDKEKEVEKLSNDQLLQLVEGNKDAK